MCMLSYFQYQDILVSCELCNVTFLCIAIDPHDCNTWDKIIIIIIMEKSPPPEIGVYQA